MAVEARAEDTIVIGGGIAGLAAAAYLGRAGRRVLVLEKAAALGGRAVTQDHDGFRFNLGTHAFLRWGGAARSRPAFSRERDWPGAELPSRWCSTARQSLWGLTSMARPSVSDGDADAGTYLSRLQRNAGPLQHGRGHAAVISGARRGLIRGAAIGGPFRTTGRFESRRPLTRSQHLLLPLTGGAACGL
jgi:glycine/D-amino acid oxidase-like deaminating enzyme